MMQFGCLLARMTPATPVPQFVASGQQQFLGDVFRANSADDIELKVNSSTMNAAIGSGSGVWALDLHLALAKLTRNPLPPSRALRIAVLYADYYKPFKAALGVMFDRGFDPGDDPNSNDAFVRSPREGCAVFLGAIAALRTDPGERASQELFTTIHELGHVFNLQHVTDLSFMKQSDPNGPFSSAAYRFTPAHQKLLESCSHSRYVCPGCDRFDQTGLSYDLPKGQAVRDDPGVELAIGMEQRSFWPFEPVELDIELRLTRDRIEDVLVPDAIDPGYECFQIWIEEPNGERRLYRSPRRYCFDGQRRVVTRGKPFLRDVSIFGESGGYAFRKPGPHKVWAAFELEPGVVLRSNEIEVEIRPPRASPEYLDAAHTLRHSGRAKLLYHRLPHAASPRQLAYLKEFSQSATTIGSKGSILYAVGRVLAQKRSGKHRQTGEGFSGVLFEALDDRHLGRRQREVAGKLLTKD